MSFLTSHPIPLQGCQMVPVHMYRIYLTEHRFSLPLTFLEPESHSRSRLSVVMGSTIESDIDQESLNKSLRSSENDIYASVEPTPSARPSSLYLFTPSKKTPILRLFRSRSTTSPLRCIIRRKSLVVVNQTVGDWHHVLCNELEGWCRVDSTREGVLSRLSNYRRFLEWGGNNKFFCQGKVMVGSDFNFFLGTNAMFIIPSILFFIFVIPDMTQPILCGVLMGLLFLYAIIALWRCALTEPGILPRNTPAATPSLPSGEHTGTKAHVMGLTYVAVT